MNTVELTVKCGLCSGCGACKGICPKNAIEYKAANGMYEPVIDEDKCVNCGLCKKVCPGLGSDYGNGQTPIEAIYGQYLDCFNVWSKDEKKRYVSASGGVVSTIIEALLVNNCYDIAFCVDSFNYREQLKTVQVSAADIKNGIEYSSIPKSRYLAVSHENAVNYIKDNPDKKVILIGTSCAIQALKKAVSILKREADNYLFLGLFCDSVFNYNILKYYEDAFGEGKSISKFHFKNKESGGWPGNSKLIFKDESYSYVDKKHRERAKRFFMSERCLYCIDKLNVNADISFGDNYTDQDSSELGSNTVIIRTSLGEKVWNYVKDFLEYRDVKINKLDKAQYLDGRIINYYYSCIKEKKIQKKYKEGLVLNKGIAPEDDYRDYEAALENALKNISVGRKYTDNITKNTEIISGKRDVSGRLEIILKKIYYRVKRQLR